MKLIVGGLNGFVGSNTTEALVQLGHDCVVTRHKDTETPKFLEKYVGKHVFVEQADATKLEDMQRLGEKHKIDTIINVGGGFKVEGAGPVPGFSGYSDMLQATFKLANDWKVKRVVMSSTGGMYVGAHGPGSEDQPVQLQNPFPFGILSYQKIVEVAMCEFGKATGITAVCVRLMGMYGPNQDPSQSSLPQRLAYAAAYEKPPDLQNLFFGNADDEVDLLYIKDVARAIAMVTTAEKLQYNVYNIASGKVTPNRQLVTAVRNVVPGFDVQLAPGRTPFPPLPLIDTKRLQADTGFTPKWDIPSAVRDYVDWLKAGNSK